jgi:hypothetical protein
VATYSRDPSLRLTVWVAHPQSASDATTIKLDVKRATFDFTPPA